MKGLINVINILKARSLKKKINTKFEEYKKANKDEIAEAEAASLITKMNAIKQKQ